ncbi:MAG: hypothetical protein WCG27_10370, partial [Pseudomonadota bacterium]
PLDESNEQEYRQAVGNYQKAFLDTYGTLSSLFLEKFSPTAAPVLPVIKEMQETFQENIKNLYGNNISVREEEALGLKISRYFQLLERELILGFAKTLALQTFAQQNQDKDWVDKLQKMSSDILFTSGNKVMTTWPDGTAVLYPYYYYRFDNFDLRGAIYQMAVHDYFPENLSYQKRQIKGIKEALKLAADKKKEEMLSALKKNGQTEENAPDMIFNWLKMEEELFSQEQK